MRHISPWAITEIWKPSANKELQHTFMKREWNGIVLQHRVDTNNQIIIIKPLTDLSSVYAIGHQDDTGFLQNMNRSSVKLVRNFVHVSCLWRFKTATKINWEQNNLSYTSNDTELLAKKFYSQPLAAALCFPHCSTTASPHCASCDEGLVQLAGLWALVRSTNSWDFCPCRKFPAPPTRRAVQQKKRSQKLAQLSFPVAPTLQPITGYRNSGETGSWLRLHNRCWVVCPVPSCWKLSYRWSFSFWWWIAILPFNENLIFSPSW